MSQTVTFQRRSDASEETHIMSSQYKTHLFLLHQLPFFYYLIWSDLRHGSHSGAVPCDLTILPRMPLHVYKGTLHRWSPLRTLISVSHPFLQNAVILQSRLQSLSKKDLHFIALFFPYVVVLLACFWNSDRPSLQWSKSAQVFWYLLTVTHINMNTTCLPFYKTLIYQSVICFINH